MDISVVIPSFNSAETIAAQLDALASQQWQGSWEVVVADNGSNDETAEIVKGFLVRLPMLRLVDASRERGASYARNVGASAARGSLLLFCDADDEVGPGWLSAMAKGLVEYDLVAGDLDIRKLNQDWVYQSLRDEIGGVEQYPDYFPYAGANNLGIKRAIHDAIGGFDLELLALQDVDYCWRAQKTGVKLESVREAIVNFRFRSSLRGMCKRRYKQGIYNVYLHKKHGLHIDWQSVTKDGLFLLPIFFTKVWDKSSLARWGMRLAWCLGQLEGRRRFGVV